MQLWQMDVMGGVMLQGGTELKVVTGVFFPHGIQTHSCHRNAAPVEGPDRSGEGDDDIRPRIGVGEEGVS